MIAYKTRIMRRHMKKMADRQKQYREMLKRKEEQK